MPPYHCGLGPSFSLTQSFSLEGTRSPDGVLKGFKKGGFVLAAKSHQPIVPISISGSYRILPKDSWTIQPGEIRLSISRPIRAGGSDSRNLDLLMKQVREAIRANLTLDEAGSDSENQPQTQKGDLHDGGNTCSNA